MKDYHINIFSSDENDGYIADIPDLEYCSAFGESPDEALSEVLLAKEAWMESARASGKTIPKPRYRPVIYQVV
ncbi:MAG: type II toxin-antitoxin system HicB family antitoxin [Candidatus Electryoneaceae bacterium]|nr:type II toxin-antitoxin system HicB family antitoxin [Candidatus Electryoneaceae bacterium]